MLFERGTKSKIREKKNSIILYLVSGNVSFGSLSKTGTAEQLWDWGAPLVTQHLGGGGGTKHFFLLILYNFKKIGGHVPPCPLPPPHPLYSAVPGSRNRKIPDAMLAERTVILFCWITVQNFDITGILYSWPETDKCWGDSIFFCLWVVSHLRTDCKLLYKAIRSLGFKVLFFSSWFTSVHVLFFIRTPNLWTETECS